ncbi:MULTISPECIES: hypothetical protein [unclassified Microbispora]|nr:MULTISPECIES: hypothetical protein [unclassified Microbispora]
MTPVEDMSGGPCGWCHHTHPSGAECVTDPQTFRPTEEETTDE